MEFFTGFALQLAIGLVYGAMGISFAAVSMDLDPSAIIVGNEMIFFQMLLGVALGVTIAILLVRFGVEMVRGSFVINDDEEPAVQVAG